LIRHAEAEGNIYRRAHGQFNGQLIGRASAQIEQLRERFLHENMDAVYSSDLSRACVTAAAISQTRGLKINTTELLREVCLGDWEDISWGDINYHFPEMGELFNSDPARWSVAGSEKYEQVQERMKRCLIDIARRHDGQTVAVFSHGFSIRAITCQLLGIPSHKIEQVPYCDNTAVALLRYEDDKFTVEYHRDTSHLRGDTSTLATQTWWKDENKRLREELRFEWETGTAPVSHKALLGNELAGMLDLDTMRGKENNSGWISQFFVKPEYRRRGFGVQLLGQSVSEYRKLRREKLCLEVEKDSPLMEFCKKYDFSKNGESGELCLMEKNIRNW